MPSTQIGGDNIKRFGEDSIDIMIVFYLQRRQRGYETRSPFRKEQFTCTLVQRNAKASAVRRLIPSSWLPLQRNLVLCSYSSSDLNDHSFLRLEPFFLYAEHGAIFPDK